MCYLRIQGMRDESLVPTSSSISSEAFTDLENRARSNLKPRIKGNLINLGMDSPVVILFSSAIKW